MPCGDEVKVLSLLWKMESDSTVLTLVGSSFHHLGAKTEKSCNFIEWALFSLGDGGNYRPADVEALSASLGHVV